MDEQERLISTSCQENPSSYQFLCQHLQWLLLLRELDPTISSSYPYVFSNYAANIQHFREKSAFIPLYSLLFFFIPPPVPKDVAPYPHAHWT